MIFLVELTSTHRDLSKTDFFKILSNSFGLRQNFWPYFLTNHHFWEICSYQLKDLLNPCLFQWFSEFKKIPTGLNKLVYKFVDFSCPQLYPFKNHLLLHNIMADSHDNFCRQILDSSGAPWNNRFRKQSVNTTLSWELSNISGWEG